MANHFTGSLFSFMKKYSLVFLFFLCSSFSFSQTEDVTFERITATEGLSSGLVIDIMQDSKGFLWLATSDGLDKYDGYEFTVYKNDPADSTSLSNNFVFSVYEDKDGNIWAGTDDGVLNKLNIGTGKFSRYPLAESVDRGAIGNTQNPLFMIRGGDDGSIWYTTLIGLVKFDPQTNQQKIYKIFPDENDFSKNIIIGLEPAKDKGFWVGSAHGILYHFDPEKEEFDKSIGEIMPALSGQIWGIYENDKGIIWYGELTQGLIKYNLNTGEQLVYADKYLPDAEKLPEIYNMKIGPDGNLWIATNSGLYKLNLKTEKFTSYIHDEDDDNSLAQNNTFSLCWDSFGVLWVGHRGRGISKYNTYKRTFKHYKNDPQDENSLAGNNINRMKQSVNDTNIVWITTGTSGFDAFNLKDKTFSHHKAVPGNKNGLSSNLTRSLDEDEEGNLWIGTDNGMDKLNLKTNTYTNYNFIPDDPNSLTSGNVNYVLLDRYTKNKDIWIGTSRGLNYMDIETGKVNRFLFIDTTYNDKIFNLIGDLTGSDKVIQKILKPENDVKKSVEFKISKKKKYLLVTEGESIFNGLFDYGFLTNAKGDTIWKPSLEKKIHAGGDLKNYIIADLIELEPGSYRLGYISDDSHGYGNWNATLPYYQGYWGVQLFEPDENQLKIFENNIDKRVKSNTFYGENIITMLQDKNGDIWIGTGGTGLSKYERKTKKFINYQMEPNNPNSLSNNIVYSTYEDTKGNLWIGTAHGLNKFDPDNNKFITYTTDNGLPNDGILGILEDDNGEIWVSTFKGLSRFDPDITNGKLTFVNYDLKDGLQDLQFRIGSQCKTNDGMLMFGGSNGFNAFYPAKINPVPPNVVVTKFQIANNVIEPGNDSPLDRDISSTSEITLSYKQNIISFDFVALQFSRPEKNQYAYMLEGLEKEWHRDNHRFASYTNLDPGEYTFRVKAANSDGIWTPEGASIKLMIKPPWWRTLWAYIGYGLVLVFGFVTFDKVQRARIRKKEREASLIREAELRAKAAEAQAKAAEAQAQLIEAENRRKTEELEEARQLQLSLLPSVMPDISGLEVAAFMRTSTEVGGDYYDYHIHKDGKITFAFGDATGHGLKAGMMVTATKSLLSSLAEHEDIVYMLSETSRCIKSMNLHILAMCLSIVRIDRDRNVEIAVAGMPPALWYKSTDNLVEEMVIKGMPLGSMYGFPYRKEKFKMEKGDILMIMSDGFPERFNPRGDMLGYSKGAELLSGVADKTPKEIIEYFNKTAEDFAEGRQLDDDMTFLVIKVV